MKVWTLKILTCADDSTYIRRMLRSHQDYSDMLQHEIVGLHAATVPVWFTSSGKHKLTQFAQQRMSHRRLSMLLFTTLHPLV